MTEELNNIQTAVKEAQALVDPQLFLDINKLLADKKPQITIAVVTLIAVAAQGTFSQFKDYKDFDGWEHQCLILSAMMQSMIAVNIEHSVKQRPNHTIHPE